MAESGPGYNSYDTQSPFLEGGPGLAGQAGRTVPIGHGVKTDLIMAGFNLEWHGVVFASFTQSGTGMPRRGYRALHATGVKLFWLMKGETPKPVLGCLFTLQLWKDEALVNFLGKANYDIRMGEPTDYGGVVSFLCSPDASYITGETIAVAGGAISRS